MITGGLKARSVINVGLLLLSTVALASCSESDIGIGGGGIDVADGGISGTGISSGSISGFSSVILNGTKLEVTPDTDIFVDEMPASEVDLKVGYVIRVQADFDKGEAKQIDYVETVLGPVTAIPVQINPDTFVGSLEVLGQTVLTNSITIFDGVDPLTLAADNVLEVSGIRNAAGDIVARYIGLKTTEDKYRVLGSVSELGVKPLTFKIGNLTVNYVNADVQNGDQVRVLGDAFNSTTSELTATSISPSTLQVSLSSGDNLELEGIVTEGSSSNFKVNGLSVDATEAIALGAIENGTELDIKPGALIEVEGNVNESAVLIASKIKIVPLSNIRVEADVESVNPDSIVVLGIEFFVDDKTQLEDDSDQQIDKFSLANLSEFDRVELRAFTLDGKFILTRLEREKPDTGIRIQGPVESINKTIPTLTVLGIDLSVDFETEFEDSNDLPFNDDQALSQQAFFDTVTESDVVKAQWDGSSILVAVDELSIEDESPE
jgi:hypothetical protein